jgi:hypothetical protein
MGSIAAFYRALKETKPSAVRFDESDVLTPEKQASFVELVEMKGLIDYRSKGCKIAFPKDVMRLVPIWSRLRLKRVDSSADA